MELNFKEQFQASIKGAEPTRVIFYDCLTCTMLCDDLCYDINYVMIQVFLCYKLYYAMILLCYEIML